MKRILAGIAILLVAAAGLVAALPYFVSSDTVRSRMVEHAELVTGLQMSFRGTPRILYSPFLGFEINGVIFRDRNAGEDEPPLVRMDTLRGQLNVLAALFGKVEIEQYQLMRPRFSLRIHADGEINWGKTRGDVWNVVEHARQARLAQQNGEEPAAQPPRSVNLGVFEIVDGTIEYADNDKETAEIITNVNARINWPSTASPFAVTGNSIWRDEAIEYSIRTEQPIALMSGASAPLAFGFNSGAFSVGFQGQANMLSDLLLTGKARVESPSIRRVSNFLGSQISDGSTLSEFSAEGDFKGTLRQFQFNNATIAMDGNQGRGVIQMTRGPDRKTSISGTLAAEQLDFTPYLSALQQDIEIGKPDIPGGELLDMVEIDLRLSAARARMGPVTISDMATSLAMHDSGAVINMGNAVLHGGTLVGKVELHNQHAGSRLHAQATLSGVDSAALSAALGLSRISMTGKGNAELQLRANGENSKALLEQSWGDLRFSIENGAIEGVDFPALFKKASVDAENTGDLELGGRTAFDRLEAEIAFHRESAWIRSIWLGFPTLAARITGRSSIDFDAIALSVRMEEAQAGDEAPPGPEESHEMDDVQLFIGGSLETPLITRIPYSAGGG